jgi:hypothetical protein
LTRIAAESTCGVVEPLRTWIAEVCLLFAEADGIGLVVAHEIDVAPGRYLLLQ